MKVLVACEESQRVCVEFRKLGHEAYSWNSKECARLRSQTPIGVAKAMAEQWGKCFNRKGGN